MKGLTDKRKRNNNNNFTQSSLFLQLEEAAYVAIYEAFST